MGATGDVAGKPRWALPGLARSPLLHFLALGGALYCLRAAVAPPAAVVPPAGSTVALRARAEPGPPAADPYLVTITAEQVGRLRETLQQNPLSRPAPADEARLIAGLVEEEILYREAVRRGLDDAEPVRARLEQNMRFLQRGDEDEDEADAAGGNLYAEALEIGLDRTDPVVRRYMVAQMRLLARAGTSPDVFTDAELADHLRRHAARFALPAFVRLSHVYLDEDRRGSALEGDAHRLLDRLRAARVAPAAAPGLGDPFFPGHHPPLAARGELAKTYGAAFADAVMRLPVDTWSGPVRSAYGLHLVWIHASVPGEPPRLADVRSQLSLELAQERQEERHAVFVRDLRRRYRVRIELPTPFAAAPAGDTYR